MMQSLYRYEFGTSIPIEEAETSLLLAIVAVESIHGEAQTRLDAAHSFDAEHRACVVDANTAIGRDLARLLAGFLTREFGPASFTVERVGASRLEPTPA